MPDTDSPKVTRTEARIMHSEREPEQTPPNRRWSCPGDHTIAAYADSVLGKFRRAWVEFHLSGCQRCRLLVAHVVKARRESDLQLPPPRAIQRAMALAGRQPARPRWTWAPVGALAGITLLTVVTIVVRKPQGRWVVVSPPTPTAPLVAKSEPTSALGPVPDVIRKPRNPELPPTILSPQSDSIMRGDRLRFSWKPIPDSRNYQVRVVKSDGDLIWEGQTDKSALQLPTEVSVKDGAYFFWITAYMQDGRTVKSAPVRFLVKR